MAESVLPILLVLSTTTDVPVCDMGKDEGVVTVLREAVTIFRGIDEMCGEDISTSAILLGT